MQICLLLQLFVMFFLWVITLFGLEYFIKKFVCTIHLKFQFGIARFHSEKMTERVGENICFFMSNITLKCLLIMVVMLISCNPNTCFSCWSDLFKMDYILHVNTDSNATLPLLEATNQHTLILWLSLLNIVYKSNTGAVVIVW